MEYKMEIAGLERSLQLFPVSDDLSIAAFILFGDVEITEAVAGELLKKLLNSIFSSQLRPRAFRLSMRWPGRRA